MVHFASVVISICESVSDVMPIFITRLSDDSGDSITGGCATAGSVGAARDSRSCTICRAVMTSLAGSRIRTTDDRPRTDFDRIVRSPGTPLSAASSGTVTSASTSLVDSPGASVCTSTSGGANSGKTSSGVVRSVLAAADDEQHRQRHDDDPVAEGERNEPAHQCPAPNSVPNSSAAPAVTTFWPAVEAPGDHRAIAECRATCTRLRA